MIEADFHDYRRANDTKVDQLTKDLSAHTAEEQLRDEIMLAKVDALTDKVAMLLAMWEQARGIVTFVKVAATVVTAVAAVWVWANSHITLK